ncbi:DoxX family protein [Haloterrigena salifodinae]|uniref:DoxX family protein n=1 Tax=Haloterrigena salifodinae TaxID=2675099 RepID=A0A8T8DZ27_9EURY|nr:DoxX family protein [Haloterrigena salifodinae]QRV14430.1 DoxX family protein [Haloterrigena salifodinae]
MDAPPRRLPTGRVVGQAALVAALLVNALETARAHEEYVVDEERKVTVAEFLRESLTDPLVVGPLLAGALVLLVAVGGYLVVRPVQRDVAAFRAAMREYTAYVPWLLRISMGIPLIGAGFGGYLISPALGLEARLLQVALGFLLLFGLATRLVAVLTLAVYLGGLAIDSILLLQLEFVPGTLAIALLGGGRPSGDHVLQRIAGTPGTVYGRFDPIYDYAREFQTRIDPYRRFLPTIVRAGLGCTFVSLGLGQKLLRPGIALAVVDRYDLTAVVPVGPELWVLGAGLSEVGLGLALLFGFFTRASAATAIGVFSLTLFALPDDPVLAHVSLFGLASALLITGSGPYAVDGWIEGYGTDEEADAPDAV